MNERMQKYARRMILTGLEQCTENEIRNFNRMYSSLMNGFDKYPPIESVVENMNAEKLDWAMEQVERTLEKRGVSTDIDLDVADLLTEIEDHLGLYSHVKLDPALRGTQLLTKAFKVIIKLSMKR